VCGVVDCDVMSVDLALGRLAARQNGVVSHGQLRELGLSEAAIAHRIAIGRLHRLHRGVYLVGTPAPPPLALETAALFACAPDAVLSHRTAARFLNLRDTQDSEIDVTVANRAPRPRAGLRIHRTRSLPRYDIRRHERLPITAPLRTVLDLAATEEPRTVERAVNEAQVHRLVTLPQLDRRLDRERGRRGVVLLRRVVAAQGQPKLTRSDAEKLFLALIEKSGLPNPETDYPIGPYKADFAWPDRMLVAELDSITFHSTQPKFVADRKRWADIDAMGWRIFRFTWWDVTDEPEALLVRLTRSLMRDAA
jgi:very-short-patch-repair endonuclease/predicted transcriptional regulator of viral defense system